MKDGDRVVVGWRGMLVAGVAVPSEKRYGAAVWVDFDTPQTWLNRSGELSLADGWWFDGADIEVLP